MPYAHVRNIVVGHDGRVCIDGLPLRFGDEVQVFVIPRQPAGATPSRHPLRGEPITYDAPFEPATPPEEWEANR